MSQSDYELNKNVVERLDKIARDCVNEIGLSAWQEETAHKELLDTLQRMFKSANNKMNEFRKEINELQFELSKLKESDITDNPEYKELNRQHEILCDKNKALTDEISEIGNYRERFEDIYNILSEKFGLSHIPSNGDNAIPRICVDILSEYIPSSEWNSNQTLRSFSNNGTLAV